MPCEGRDESLDPQCTLFAEHMTDSAHSSWGFLGGRQDWWLQEHRSLSCRPSGHCDTSRAKDLTLRPESPRSPPPCQGLRVLCCLAESCSSKPFGPFNGGL